MLNGSQTGSNMTSLSENQELLKTIIVATLSTVPSVIFLYINGTILFTLRSKAVFRDTSRYILLYNLLLTDTLQLAQSQLHFLLSNCKVKMAYSICIFLNFLASLTTGISPLTLVVMPLERYVAVCFPLRHSSIITIRNTNVVIMAIWAVSSLNNLTRVFWFLKSSSEKNEIWKLKDLCSTVSLILGALTNEYDRAYTCVVFVSAGVAATFSYVGVIKAARSASTNKALANKARHTLLLNLIQLGLSLSSTIYTPLIIGLSKILTRLAFLWVWNVLYVFFIIFPRCLSSLIYGLRDQTIRPVLLYYLCCPLRVEVTD
ncbi:PREDICTED: olfactory receptor 1073-like [Cyprinodon variegatus]|uniref:Olfactory receptor 1073-like n=1 Tax=Cyprinodon variegatus TaxID=28743 RepID=A0A3Q2EFU5_CYPVA|nr:PREDICTED: olfactory receptor 1073-like [Cyprinodon variegatus]